MSRPVSIGGGITRSVCYACDEVVIDLRGQHLAARPPPPVKRHR